MYIYLMSLNILRSCVADIFHWYLSSRIGKCVESLALHSCLVHPLRVYDECPLSIQCYLCVGTHPTLVYAADMPQQHKLIPHRNAA